MKDLNIPTWFIVLTFVFGAWPIGVVLIILRVISENAKEAERAAARKRAWEKNKATRQNTVYSSKFHAQEYNFGDGRTVTASQTKTSNYKTPEQIRAELQKMREEIAKKNAESGKPIAEVNLPKEASAEKAAEPDTTYHYSYVKNRNQAADGGDTMKTWEAPTEKRQAAPKKKESAPKNIINYVKTKFKYSGATVWTTIAFFVSLFFSALLFLNAVDNIVWLGLSSSMSDVIATMVSSTITAALYLFRQYYKTRDYRIISYLSVLRNERIYSIPKLAQIADVSTSRAIKDLHYMQSKGLLGPYALIDKRTQYLILAPDGKAEADAEYNKTAGLSREEAKRERDEDVKNETEAVSEEVKLSEHEKILRRIRELNDDIDDPTVSEKIDQIEELTRKIFNLVEEKPELQPQIQSFLSYYLPTTLKLLNSYAYFEEQGIKGENISAGMKNIEETLDMLVGGYQNQLDKLFEADTLDVTTDINVLEQMMKADGFTKTRDFDVAASENSDTDLGYKDPDFSDPFGFGSGAAMMTEDDEEKK